MGKTGSIEFGAKTREQEIRGDKSGCDKRRGRDRVGKKFKGRKNKSRGKNDRGKYFKSKNKKRQDIKWENGRGKSSNEEKRYRSGERGGTGINKGIFNVNYNRLLNIARCDVSRTQMYPFKLLHNITKPEKR